MFNVLCHQGNADQNLLRLLITLVRMTVIDKLQRGGANALMVRL